MFIWIEDERVTTKSVSKMVVICHLSSGNPSRPSEHV
jgi:hypothetical protein